MSQHNPQTPRGRLPVLLALTMAFALLAASCGDDGSDTATDDSTSSSVDATDTTDTTDTSTAGDTTATTTDPDATTATSGSTGSSSTVPTGDLPGDPFEGFAQPGDVLGVVGVAHDDKLNIREAPGTDQALLTRVGPLEDSLTATGRARSLSRSIWYEVSTDDGITGWANIAFLAFFGAVDDATAEFLDGGDLPVAATMQQLGELVAEGFASTEPESDIVQTVAPSTGDLAEVTYDVIGLGDDALLGYRLHIFATPNGDSDEGFTLKSIERTSLCGRGLAGELCV